MRATGDAANEVDHGMEMLRPRLFEGSGVHGVWTTRAGGASTGPYGTLNMGFHVGDSDGAVLENRRRVASALGLGEGDLTSGVQSHSNGVAVVHGADRGRGAARWEDGFEGTDALVTREPGLPLMVVAADCLLLALADPRRGVVAAVHASRRSAIAGIVGSAVELVASEFGCEPAEMIAALGPHIGECCYEVGPDVEEEACAARGDVADDLFLRPEGAQPRFRLAHLVRGDLTAFGVPERSIEEMPGCTACEADRFYSYRRDGAETGRHALIVWTGTMEA